MGARMARGGVRFPFFAGECIRAQRLTEASSAPPAGLSPRAPALPWTEAGLQLRWAVWQQPQLPGPAPCSAQHPVR
eukprot:scaffold142342_cov19-Tisochrysis_lutea.AAC.2